MNINSQITHWAQLVRESFDDYSYAETIREDNESEVPTISSIKEFLDICKKRNLSIEKKKVNKQGKVVSAKIADKDQTIKSREGDEQIKKGSLIVDDGDGYSYAVPQEKIKEFYEVNDDGSSATGDNTKWRKQAKQLEYYITPFDVDVKVNWQNEPLHAKNGYALVANDQEGKDISPVAPEKFQDKSLWKSVNEDTDWRMNEGIGDFFGKLFNTKAYQKKVADAEYEKKHTLVKVAKAYGDDCQFAQALYANDGYPIDFYTTYDVICFKGDVDKNKLMEAFKTAGYEDLAKNFTVERVGNKNILVHYHDNQLEFEDFEKAPIF